MKTIIRHAVIGLFALLCGGAFADGVPLITPGPVLKALTQAQAEQAASPAFVKHHPILINKDALMANVITVKIDGKEYRFVGSLGPTIPGNPPAAAAPVASGAAAAQKQPRQPDLRAWSGRTGTLGKADYGTLVAVLSSDGAVTGSIHLPPARDFVFTSRLGVMTESDSNKARPFKLETAKPIELPASSPLWGAQK